MATLLPPVETFQSMFEALSDGVALVDDQLQIQYCNSRFAELLQLEPDSLVGRAYYTLFPSEVALTVHERRDQSFEILLQTAKGLRCVSFSLKPLPSSAQNLLVCCDVTDQKTTEADLKSAQAHTKRNSERFQRILDILPASFAAIDNQWRLIAVNESVSRFTGKSIEDLLGCYLWEAYPNFHGSLFEQQAQKAFETQKPVHFEDYAKKFDLWYECDLYPFDEGLVAFSNNITEQKRVELALQESEKRFRELTEAVPVIVWRTSAAGEVEYLNSRWYEYTGMERGCSLNEIRGAIHPDDREHISRAWPEALKAGTLFETEVRYKRFDGEYRWFLARVIPQRDESGALTGWFATSTDIEDRRRWEMAVVEHQEDTEQMNRRLKQTVQETNHRVKNNLQLIAAMVEIQAGQNDTIPAEQLKRIGKQMRGLASVHDFLTLEFKNDRPEHSVSSREILSRLCALWGEIGSLPLSAEIAEARISAKQGASLTLLLNELISNALKHASGKIEVRFETQDREARLIVADDGNGFPEGFDAQKSAHTGLELIVQLTRWDLRGSVRFENHEGGGAQVTITFPVGGEIASAVVKPSPSE